MTGEFSEAVRALNTAVDRVSDEFGEFREKQDTVIAKQYALESAMATLTATVNAASHVTTKELGRLEVRHEEREKIQRSINNKLFERMETLERTVATKVAWLMGAIAVLQLGGGVVIAAIIRYYMAK